MAGENNSDFLIALTTLASEADARSLVGRLVDAGIVACGTIVPGAVSLYRWEGRVAEDAEALVVLKTSRSRWDDLVRAVDDWHPYDVPELIATSIEAGAHRYLDWLGAATQKEQQGSNG